MRASLVISLLVVFCAPLSESINLNEELVHYNNQIRIAYRLLEKECPNQLKTERDIYDEEIPSADLEVRKMYYKNLLRQLIRCRRETMNISTPKYPDTTAGSTTDQPTTTSQFQTDQCTSATNLTESWRMDHAGKNLKGGGPRSYVGWACDLRKDLQWFRFTGAAGKRIFLSHN